MAQQSKLAHPMPEDYFQCPGCHVRFERQAGYARHLSTSTQPQCITAYQHGLSHTAVVEAFGDQRDSGPSSGRAPIRDYFNWFQPHQSFEPNKDSDDTTTGDSPMEVDPPGNPTPPSPGRPASLEPIDQHFEHLLDSDEIPQFLPDDPIGDGDLDVELDEEFQAQLEAGWEENRETLDQDDGTPQPKNEGAEDNSVSTPRDQSPHCEQLYDGDTLRFKPSIVPYPSQRAGEPIEPPPDIGGEAEDDTDNPYHPFATHLEWEIARWAKLRGPGSTAFTELLAINGVSLLNTFVISCRAYLLVG